MGLPWVQIAKEFPSSPEAFALAHQLGIAKAWAVGLATQFWCWAADHAADGRVDGAWTALAVDAAAGWELKPGGPSFCDAMVSVGLLEQDGNGVRICGWDRYAKALEKAAKDAVRKRERRADGARTARGHPPDGAGTAPGRRENGAGKSQIESQSQNKLPTEACADAPPAPEKPFELKGEPAPKAKKRSEGQEFWDWCQDERTRKTGLVREKEPDAPKLNRWFAEAVADAGSLERLERAFARYVLKPLDDYWPKRGFPVNGFMSKWRDYAPAEEVAA